MKKIRVYSGFFSKAPLEYKGEYVYKVIGVKEQRGARYFLLEHDGWIKTVGQEMYIGRSENEIWGRAEEVETDEATGEICSVKELGFLRMA